MLIEKNILLDAQTTWLEHWLSKNGVSKPVSLKVLAGDGSNRKFYRLILTPPDGGPNKTYILLTDPDWLSSKDYPAHQAYLASQQIPVPSFIAVDAQVGVLLMEDAGDEYLQHRLLEEANPLPFWEAATKLIAEFHGKTYPVPGQLPGAQRRFDRQKLSDELRFTIEHLAVGFLELPPPSKKHWEKIDAFCENLASIKPWVLCHRDYHSRNLMVDQGQLVLIDFQDARLGPPQYDLASLLYDAYAPLSETHRLQLSKLYLQTIASYSVAQEISMANFSSQLKAVAFQRLVKAAGSFASFYTRYKKTSHLAYLIPSLTAALSLQQSGCVPSNLAAVFPLGDYLEQSKKKIAQITFEATLPRGSK